MRILAATKRLYNGVTTFDYIFLVVGVLLPMVLAFVFASGAFMVLGCLFTLIAAFMLAKYRDRRVDYAAISVAVLGTVFLIIGCAMGGSVIGYIAVVWPIVMWGSVFFARYYFKFNLPEKFKIGFLTGWIAFDAIFVILLSVAFALGATNFAPFIAALLLLIGGEVYGLLVIRDKKVAEKSSVKEEKEAKQPAK